MAERGAGRWWQYQRERFPLAAHGPLILAFSLSAVCHSALLRGDGRFPSWSQAACAFVCCLILFLQLRIADEFKDFDEDCRWRPYRPVPRGLVSLRELAWVAVLGGLCQFASVWLLQPALSAWLLVVWIYLALMSREFFVRDWIKRRPVTYLWSHMLIMPLVDFLATACDWGVRGDGPPPGLHWFLAASFCNGMVIEIGRKVRSPPDEEPGVETYSVLWGQTRAAGVWIAMLVATALCAWLAAGRAGFGASMLVGLVAFVAIGAVVAVRFAGALAPGAGRRIEQFSGLWTLVLYLGLGVVPMAVRALGGVAP